MNIINPYRFAAGAAFDGFGNASRSFDGTNDYIGLGDSDDFSFGDGAGNDSPFSIAAWVKLDVTTGNRAIVSKYVTGNAEWMLFYHSSSNEFRWAVYQSSGVQWIRARSSVTINASQWYHVVGTYDGSKSLSGMKMYVDGSIDTTNDTSGGTYTGMTNGTTSVFIGKYDSTWFLDGKVADVRLYDAELGSSTISDLASGTDYQTNLIGWWIDDDDDVLDNAGTNDGTNNGTTYDADGPAD